MQKRRIIYIVDVDFPPGTSEPVITLWADGIARGIEHNKPEVNHIEYAVQERSIDHERQLGELGDPDQESSAYTEALEEPPKQLPPADEV